MSESWPEPKIRILHAGCPFCKKPTGDKCGEVKESSDDNPFSGLGQLGGEEFQINSPLCLFAREAVYSCDVNYRVSPDLLKSIGKINGVVWVKPRSNYRFDFSVAPLFDKKEVTDQVNLAYRNFIQELNIINANKNDIQT